MSYSRIPYIYSNGNEMFVDGQYIEEDLINILLYELHKPYRKEELEERIKLGKEAKERIEKESEKMLEYTKRKYNGKIIKSRKDLIKFRKEMIERKQNK